MGAAFSAPVINDVSTSLDDPPTFSKSQHQPHLPDSFKAAIRKHYAHLQPLAVPGGDPAAVFAAAKRAAAAALPRGRVVLEDASAGVLELLDVTPLMRFKDDVVLRVRQAGQQVVVDVRSSSRLGKGDLGCNAARIARLLGALRAELGQQQGGSMAGRAAAGTAS